MTVKEPGATEDDRVGETVAGPVGEVSVQREEPPLDVRIDFWLETFPWFPAFTTGMGAFLLGYAGLFATVLLTSVSLPEGSLSVRVGFLFYNAHNVVVTGVTPALPDSVSLTMNYLPRTDQPWLYRLFPAAVLTAASALFTFLRAPLRGNTWAAIATGMAMGTGYVLVALAGTFAFSLPANNILYQPSRAGTMIWILGYGLLFGICGSLCGQAAVTASLRT